MSRCFLWLAASSAFAISHRFVSRSKGESDIEGSGYCVESLEAALWCFANTESYSEAVLSAANLGDDADTTAAICGQLAGAFYGSSGIPNQWLDRLVMRSDISSLSDELLSRSADATAARDACD
jgi:ADP-ribosyl-[dinitrogen reductase] hydrolase